MKCIECFRRLADHILNHKIYWLFLLLSVIEVAFIMFPICYHNVDKDNITTKSENLKKWNIVSEGKLNEISDKLEVVSIEHWPPRPVHWDGNIIITATIVAKEKTAAYVYVREKEEKSGLLYLVKDNISKGKQRLQFQIDMGSDNLLELANIQNAELYILDSDHKMTSVKPEVLPHKFDVTFVENYLTMMGVLATITAIIVALLSLWAQLNARLVYMKSARPRKLGATLNLFWIYMAVFIALLGLICFLSAFSPGARVTPRIMPLYFVGWGLLISSIAMVVLSVFESMVSIFIKGFIKFTTPFDPSFIVYPEIYLESDSKRAFALLIFFALSLCISLFLLIADGFGWIKWWILIFPLLGGGGVLGVHIWVAKKYGY